jgi:hypothetical protein
VYWSSSSHLASRSDRWSSSGFAGSRIRFAPPYFLEGGIYDQQGKGIEAPDAYEMSSTTGSPIAATPWPS